MTSARTMLVPTDPRGNEPGAARGPTLAERSVARLCVRLIRRGALLLAVVAVAYVALEVLGYVTAYPDAAARARLAELAENPAIRMLQGVPHAIATPGGYFAWDGGWMLQGMVGVWALLATSRLLRGEEDAGRTELLLAGPVPAARVVAAALLVVDLAAALLGGTVTAALVGTGTGVAGSVLFGVGLAGFAGTSAGVAAVTAQVFAVRRRAVGVAGTLFGAFFLLRMAGNSTDGWGWLRWLTPFGWMDELHAYGDNRWAALTPLLLAPVALGVVAVRLRGARDASAGLIRGNDHREARLGLLGSPIGFAWRSTRGVLLAWLISLAAYACLAGGLVKTVTDYVAKDPTYRDSLAALGVDPAEAARGFVAVMSGLLGLLFVLYAAWRVGVARAEETATRLDLILVRPIRRWRWLGGHVALTMLAAGLLAGGSGAAIWIGGVLGGAGVTLADAVAATVNLLPVVALFTGIAVAALGVAPRLTVGLPVGAAVLSYVLGLLGPALRWPIWVINLSPFSHLALVPAEPFAVTPVAVMVALGVTATVVGVAAFSRRDLVGH